MDTKLFRARVRLDMAVSAMRQGYELDCRGLVEDQIPRLVEARELLSHTRYNVADEMLYTLGFGLEELRRFEYADMSWGGVRMKYVPEAIDLYECGYMSRKA